jgi:hypothetical protein
MFLLVLYTKNNPTLLIETGVILTTGRIYQNYSMYLSSGAGEGFDYFGKPGSKHPASP